VVEHELDVIRHADWIVDVGPAAGEHGGQILYSGPPGGLEIHSRIEKRGFICFGQIKPRPSALPEPRVDGFGWRA